MSTRGAQDVRRRRARSGAPKPSSGGFSLVEVLVALVVLTAGALTVAASMVVATSANTHAGELSRASALASQKLEEIKAMPADEVDDEAAIRVNARGVPTSGGAYVREVDVVDESEGAPENTKRVTVTVEFSSGAMGQDEATMFTILYVNPG
ncbi:MAG: prepilin-type N-terminal cleavage/methylation domain-containing protein [Candidatus Palauibacterales bacterium]|nr:prepilin-type N-terminal cleavage/methylation domain-containing protein [Candidatus Palauibacterales bacterium]